MAEHEGFTPMALEDFVGIPTFRADPEEVGSCYFPDECRPDDYYDFLDRHDLLKDWV